MFGGQRTPEAKEVNDDELDDDDVDIYVSPRRFVGRTPGPKATKQRIFEEERDAANAQKSQPVYHQQSVPEKSIALGIENVKYTIGHGEDNSKENAAAHKAIRRNTFLSWVLLVVNYILIVFSFYIMALSIWTFTQQGNGGLAAYLSVDGFALRSPTTIGVSLFFAGAAGAVNAFFLGVGHVVPSVVEGLDVDSRRRGFTIHQLLSSFTLALFTFALLATLKPLLHLMQAGVSTAVWRDMAGAHPDELCAFQVRAGCAGSMDMMCTTPAANGHAVLVSTACPGHYCIEVCNALSPDQSKIRLDGTCRNCRSFHSSSALLKCKASEARPATSRNCRGILVQEGKRFLLIVVISCAVVLSWTVVVVLVSIISPLLSIS